MQRYLGIDLGGTKTAVGLVTAAGEVLDREIAPTPARQGPAQVMEAVIEAERRLRRRTRVPRRALAGVGVGAPGPIDQRQGLVVAPPNLKGWQAVDLAGELGARLGCRVRLDNDANCAGLAESRFGAGQGASPLVYLTVSTGIGGAILIDGHPLAGARGAAGELGHAVLDPKGPACGCGGRGCLEAFASGTAIAARAREAVRRGRRSTLTDRFGARPGRITAQVVARAAAGGDRLATGLISDAMAKLGLGVASLVNQLNPERVVIGGGLTALGADLFDPVRAAVDSHSNPVAAGSVEILPATLGAEVGIVGAAALVMP